MNVRTSNAPAGTEVSNPVWDKIRQDTCNEFFGVGWEADPKTERKGMTVKQGTRRIQCSYSLLGDDRTFSISAYDGDKCVSGKDGGSRLYTEKGQMLERTYYNAVGERHNPLPGVPAYKAWHDDGSLSAVEYSENGLPQNPRKGIPATTWHDKAGNACFINFREKGVSTSPVIGFPHTFNAHGGQVISAITDKGRLNVKNIHLVVSQNYADMREFCDRHSFLKGDAPIESLASRGSSTLPPTVVDHKLQQRG